MAKNVKPLTPLGVPLFNDEVNARVFGSGHSKPCLKAEVHSCTMWPCQVANECQARAMASRKFMPKKRLLQALGEG